ncbi:hypothetical protein [Nocardiopsis sp. TNDT3]|uniref:hypothetical protein n=1 Tax=Nocardiopsis sp. TNDT3 TaxID=2249354 RepID=UPI000E3CF161|nr:hypothetical protein [Nocardiopsis sp. TNDT3]
MSPGLEDALTALLRGEWILTTRSTDDGGQVLVAHRPIGWTGPGDPGEELVADTHTEMRALLARRYHQKEQRRDDPRRHDLR